MKIQAHSFEGKAHLFLVEVTDAELVILTSLSATDVENVAVGAEISIDPNSPFAQRHLRAQKVAAAEVLAYIAGADPTIKAEVDALVAKLDVPARADAVELPKP